MPLKWIDWEGRAVHTRPEHPPVGRAEVGYALASLAAHHDQHRDSRASQHGWRACARWARLSDRPRTRFLVRHSRSAEWLELSLCSTARGGRARFSEEQQMSSRTLPPARRSAALPHRLAAPRSHAASRRASSTCCCYLCVVALHRLQWSRRSGVLLWRCLSCRWMSRWPGSMQRAQSRSRRRARWRHRLRRSNNASCAPKR